VLIARRLLDICLTFAAICYNGRASSTSARCLLDRVNTLLRYRPVAGGAFGSYTHCPRIHHIRCPQVVLSKARCSVDAAKQRFSSATQHCIRLQISESRDPPCSQSTVTVKFRSSWGGVLFGGWSRGFWDRSHAFGRIQGQSRNNGRHVRRS